MKYDENLSEFNRRFADVLLPTFPSGVEAVQADDGTLLFRGPIPLASGRSHVGTHVSVSLDSEVVEALYKAAPLEREEMTEMLVSVLGTQIRARYNPNEIGEFALDVVGAMDILRL